MVTAIDNTAAIQAALAAVTLVTLYEQYVVRFGLDYREEIEPNVQISGYSDPAGTHFAQLIAPLGH